jgi:hypothetical protein
VNHLLDAREELWLQYIENEKQAKDFSRLLRERKHKNGSDR